MVGKELSEAIIYTVAVKKKFPFRFRFTAVQRYNRYRTVYVLLRFVVCNNTCRAIPFFDPVPFFHMCKFEQQSVIFRV